MIRGVFCTLLLFAQLYSLAQEARVYQFDIKEEIAPPIWRKVKLAMDEAHELEVDAIVINMNTYGGAVDAADSIRTKILQSDIPVYVLIENNAASAGALISLACDSIFMQPGSTIGAATVVNQSGELVGVAVSGLDKGSTEGINFAIKSEAVKTFLTSNNIKPSTNYYSKDLKNDKLPTILEEATVYTFCN